MSRLSNSSLGVYRVLLIKIFDVVKLAQLVVVMPIKSSLSPPMVQQMRWTLDLWGQSVATSRV